MNRRRAIRFSLITLLLGVGGILLVTSCLYLYLSPKLPSAEELKDVRMQIPLRVTSQDLKIIGEFGNQKRTPVDFEDIPKQMVRLPLCDCQNSPFRGHQNGVPDAAKLPG